MRRHPNYGTHQYRSFDIIRREYETAAIFRNGKCIASGIPTIQDARKHIDGLLAPKAAQPVDNRTQDDNFDLHLHQYLLLIGGPLGPQDSPIVPKSHWRLQSLMNEYGRDRVNKALDKFFEENPNW